MDLKAELDSSMRRDHERFHWPEGRSPYLNGVQVAP
jgi:hypothetical protein